ncbi:MAG: ABC transporter permease [Bacteroidales bacterium]
MSILNIYDITWPHLALGYLSLVIPFGIFYLFRAGLTRDGLIAIARMTLQLFLVGLYLEIVFAWDNSWVNMAWVVIMIVVATLATTRGSNVKARYFFLPGIMALAASVIFIDAFFIGLVIRPDNVFQARYFIPITGMIIGNCMERNIIAMNSFYKQLQREEKSYRYLLANGGSRQEALRPFFRTCLRNAFNPLIANTAVIGLIALPGTMTGQILGGSSPGTAIRYQILLILAIMVASSISVILTLLISNRTMFDSMDNLRQNRLKSRE